MSDEVNHPSHYTAYEGFEVIDITEQLNFNLGNAVKYIFRAGKKEGVSEVTDLEKAEWYIRREIKRLNPTNGGEPQNRFFAPSGATGRPEEALEDRNRMHAVGFILGSTTLKGDFRMARLLDALWFVRLAIDEAKGKKNG